MNSTNSPSSGRLTAVILGIALAGGTLLIAELALRLTNHKQYFVWPPNLVKQFQPPENSMPGVSDTATFKTNAYGIRGAEFGANDHFRILAMGGSTTESIFLDQEETWPEQLNKNLQQSTNNNHIWVGNLGKSGNDARHHIVQLIHTVPILPKIDLIVILLGVNDLNVRLIAGNEPKKENRLKYSNNDAIMDVAFSVRPRTRAGLFDVAQSELWRLLRAAKYLFAKPELYQDEHGAYINRSRTRRKRASIIVSTPPNLDDALSRYTANLDRILDLGAEISVPVVLMTQPTMWRADLSPEMRDLLWFGWIGELEPEEPQPYYSLEVLAAGMARFNQSLVEVCDRRRVYCLDLSALVPKDSSSFYDDFHFNENGAKIVAKELAKFLTDRGLIMPRLNSDAIKP